MPPGALLQEAERTSPARSASVPSGERAARSVKSQPLADFAGSRLGNQRLTTRPKCQEPCINETFHRGVETILRRKVPPVVSRGEPRGEACCHLRAGVRAGQAAARAAGKTWGGSEKGRRVKVTPQQTRIIRQMKGEGETVVAMAKATGLSRPTVYSVMGEVA
jgi:hypothetical protein